MDKNQKITLKTPIKQGDGEIKSLELREPKAGELRGLKLLDVLQLDYNAIEELLPRIGTPVLSRAQIADLSLSDLANISAALGRFFEGKP